MGRRCCCTPASTCLIDGDTFCATPFSDEGHLPYSVNGKWKIISGAWTSAECVLSVADPGAQIDWAGAVPSDFPFVVSFNVQFYAVEADTIRITFGTTSPDYFELAQTVISGGFRYTWTLYVNGVTATGFAETGETFSSGIGVIGIKICALSASTAVEMDFATADSSIMELARVNQRLTDIHD